MEAPEATCTYLTVAFFASNTPRHCGVDEAGQAQRFSEFLVAVLAASAPPEELVQKTGEASLAQLLETSLACFTPTARDVIQCGARKAPRPDLAPTPSTVRAPRYQVVACTGEAQRPKLRGTSAAD